MLRKSNYDEKYGGKKRLAFLKEEVVQDGDTKCGSLTTPRKGG